MKLVTLALVTLAVSLHGQNNQSQPQTGLASIRAAMGGQALTSIKSIRLITRERDRLGGLPGRANASGSTWMESRSEFVALFPDTFSATIEILAPPMVAGQNSKWGFVGSKDTGSRGPYSRQTFGYLMLEVLLRTDTVFPFLVKGSVGDAIRLSDPRNIEVLVEIDPATHLPRRFKYQEPVRTREGISATDRNAMTVEVGAFKRVGSLTLPHTLSTIRDGVVVQERQVENFELNPKIGPEALRK